LTITGIFSGCQTKLVSANDSLKLLITHATVRITRLDYQYQFDHPNLFIGIDATGLGTGTITTILGRKYVLTANHVIKGAVGAYIDSQKDGSWGTVDRTVAWHERFDIAAIPLPAFLNHLPAIPLDVGRPPVGDTLYLGSYAKGFFHLTTGKVSGYIYGGNEMLHTVPTLEGSSGGALITKSGRIGGIHTGVYLPSSKLWPHKTATPSSVITHLIHINKRR